MKKIKDLKLKIFGIKPKNPPIRPRGVLKTLVPKEFPDGNKNPVWDSEKFENKIYI